MKMTFISLLMISNDAPNASRLGLATLLSGIRKNIDIHSQVLQNTQSSSASD